MTSRDIGFVPVLDLNGTGTAGINYTAIFTETNNVYVGSGAVFIVDSSNLSLTTSDGATITSFRVESIGTQVWVDYVGNGQ